jgi:ribosomal protein S6
METEINKEKGDNVTVYEVSYILLPSLALEQVPAKASSLKGVLTSAGGAVISDEDPILIDLAYPMTKVVGVERHKATSGYFGWVKFELPTEGMEAVKKAFDGDAQIIRYLIIKTVKENTLLNGKMSIQKEERIKKDDELSEISEEVKESSPEEVDKSIDDLVIA